MSSNYSTELTTFNCQPQAPASTDVEPLHDATHDSSTSAEGFSLPPTDGGKDAWLCLFACFMLEAMIWGMGHSSATILVLTWHRLSIFVWNIPGVLQYQ
jgi:hypothetical protein